MFRIINKKIRYTPVLLFKRRFKWLFISWTCFPDVILYCCVRFDCTVLHCIVLYFIALHILVICCVVSYVSYRTLLHRIENIVFCHLINGLVQVKKIRCPHEANLIAKHSFDHHLTAVFSVGFEPQSGQM